MPVPTVDASLDDFEDGDLVGKNGGNWTFQSGGVSTITVDLVTGCTLTSSLYAGHCYGTRGPDNSLDYASFTLNVLAGAQPFDALVAAPSRALTFSYKADTIGQSIGVMLYAGASYSYQYTFTATDLAWHEVTVYFPDVSDPSLNPRFADDISFPWTSYSQQLQSISFFPVGTGSTYSYGFSIDDVHFGEPASANSPADVSAALAMPVSDVQEAYSYHLDEQLTWILIVLSRHCGCHPHDIMTMRETRSWGQIAIDLGSTWAAILAEVGTATASFADPVLDLGAMERSLMNGPLPPVRPAAQFYVPVDQYQLSSPLGGCP